MTGHEKLEIYVDIHSKVLEGEEEGEIMKLLG